MSTSKPLDPSRGYAAQFGIVLRELRIARGWTQAELGVEIRLSDSAISKFETGERVPPEDIVDLLDKVLGANGRLIEEWDSISESADARWARRLFAVEASAATIHYFAMDIPPHLQTESYARALLVRGMAFYGGDLEEKVQIRMRRVSALHRDPPPQFSALIYESALGQVAGTAGVMRDQLLCLAKMSEEPHVHLQVIPNNSSGLMAFGNMMITKPRAGKRSTLYTATFNRARFSTNPEELAWHEALYRHVQLGALTEEQSRELIVNSVEEKYPCAPAAPN
ncbi:helix-turn-helix transcriptional regulator [Streptomyces sp. UNOC14_S4]|uniref:helix-turn-helix domain-containing protein n=1 Tax=Streptomyces sp. UNOC14_S4 TaxID=2872340 RepID=UPI001E5FAF1F|nr:helix-turn-helix transcriptional regulator [Streptomyces sp. UNOC14_S4]MCC3769672.1 helix-turn-helix domain-containing protein [Streptomyces sp. UNOC14_S4]